MDHSANIKVLKQLARTEGETANKALEKEATKISDALENETRFDLLEQQLERLDTFAYRVPEKAVRIVRRFLDRLGPMELTHNHPLNLSVSQLAKYETKSDLIIKALNLLDRIRYHRPEDILAIFVSHYTADDDEVSKHAAQGLEHLAEYNIDIYYSGDSRVGLGPAPQIAVLEWLEALTTAAREQNFFAVVELCGHLLSPRMSGTSWDYKSVTWSSGAIPATDHIKDIRSRSLKLLRTLHRIATTTSHKLAIVNAMLSVTRMPRQGEYGDNVVDMVSQNTLEVLMFFKQILFEEDLQIVQQIEHDSFWRFRHAATEDVRSAALEIRDLLETYDEYTIYKDLVGFEGVFEDWEQRLTHSPDFNAIDAHRSAKALEYAESINAENWDEWRTRIIRYAKTESNDLATFPYFYKFLQRFAEVSPDLAFGLLQIDLEDIRFFTIPLLRGLWRGSRKNDMRALMLDWIEKNRQLVAITKLFWSNEDLDEEIIETLLDKSAREGNPEILILMVGVVATNYERRNGLVSKLFLPAIKALTELKNAGWIHELWFRKERNGILESLGDDDWQIVLNGLLWASEIDFHAEEILIPLAKRKPERIIAFFGERIQHEKEIGPETHYDAIPFEFHRLHEVLAKTPAIAVDVVRSWFDGNDPLFQYRGAKLLQIIFRDFAKPFRAKLLELVRTGERENLEFVLSVLSNYQGESFLHEICREIVAALPNNDELLRIVSIVLQSTGVVTGEYGLAEAYERKIEEINAWLNDDNEVVRHFAGKYVAELEHRARLERRRAEEDIELRKHTYGVREEQAENGDATNEQKEVVKEGGSEER